MSANLYDGSISHAISRIDVILQSNILATNHFLQQSAFIEVLVRLHELTFKANEIGKRIAFTDDVRLFPGVKDITDAIREYRNAACHIYHDAHFISPGGHPRRRGEKLKSGEGYKKISFTTLCGKVTLIHTSRYDIGSDYDDDVCFIFGAHKMYLKRHIVRAFQEARAVLEAHYQPRP